MNFKFNIGDKVKIVNSGQTYSTYADKFIELGFKNEINNPGLPHGTVGTVFGTSFDRSERKIYAIRTRKGEEVLIGEPGIEIVDLKDDIYEVSGVFILEAYKAACSEWKKKLEAKFPELFLQDDSKIYTVTREQIKILRRKVCSEWQEKIDTFMKGIDPYVSKIEIPEILIKEGLEEANILQREYIIRLFKYKPSSEIDISSLNVGEAMVVTKGNADLTSLKVEPSNKKIFGEKMNTPVQVILNK